MRSLRYIIPLLLFGAIALFLWRGLELRPSEIPSPLVGKAAPAISLPQLNDPAVLWTPAQMAGKVWLLNVWGSWCPECRIEHPLLNELARRDPVPIVGLAWKDTPEKAQAWLAQLGNPYTLSVIDQKGRAAIDFGVYGAPETFVIDRNGIIQDKIIGGITPEIVRDRLMPLINRLRDR